MKLGIVSDIHEAVELLATALARFESIGVDRVIVLGDVFETGARIDETVALLARAGAVGVYGNHDFGLSVDPREDFRLQFPGDVLGFMTTLRARWEVEGYLFAHREPWLDGSRVEEIWHADEEPLTAELILRSFDAAPDHRAIFTGHHHRWMATTRAGVIDWDGSSPLRLHEMGPTMIIVNGVCEGYAATLDTATGLFTPVELYEPGRRPASRPLPRQLTVASEGNTQA